MRSSDASAHANTLHRLILSAAETGELPAWAVCKPARREHTQRVAKLMESWAVALGIGEPDRLRWRAAAILHDALRDADPDDLVGRSDLDWPPQLLHGPACAARLAEDGVDDVELLDAIAFHTVGNPCPSEISDYLYMADFLEPGRKFRTEERAAMRDRLPAERDAVLREVATLRLAQRLERGERLLAESVEFWNRVAD